MIQTETRPTAIELDIQEQAHKAMAATLALEKQGMGMLEAMTTAAVAVTQVQVQAEASTAEESRDPEVSDRRDHLDVDTESEKPASVMEDLSPGMKGLLIGLMNDPSESTPPSTPKTSLADLPTEILESIFDNLLGVRRSAWKTAGARQTWSKQLRHPRRKAVSDLALLSRRFRPLVQGRIYRHIKIKGTKGDLEHCAEWFLTHEHLIPLVRHVEFWIPVWGERSAIQTVVSGFAGSSRQAQSPPRPTPTDGTASPARSESGPAALSGTSFTRATHNASLEEIFHCVDQIFTNAKVLTIEGGHCKRPPLVRYFSSGNTSFPPLPNIQTLIMRSAWTLMRDISHWKTIAEALPNIREWQCDYAKSKAEAIFTTAKILRALPPSLVHLNLVMEGLYSREKAPRWAGLGTQAYLQELQDTAHPHHQHAAWLGPGAVVNSINGSLSQTAGTSGSPSPHLCRLLGYMSLGLESVSYTGRVCHQFFAGLAQAVEDKKVTPALRSIELVVKNCCRPRNGGSRDNEGTVGTAPQMHVWTQAFNGNLAVGHGLAEMNYANTNAALDHPGFQHQAPVPSISSPVTPTTNLTQDPYATATDDDATSTPNTIPILINDTPDFHSETTTPLGTADIFNTPFPTSFSNETVGTGTGIMNPPFINAFENITISAVRILGLIPTLRNISIRHIDLDSACPLLNPYFTFSPIQPNSSSSDSSLHSTNGPGPKYQTTGLWSDEILALLNRVRPGTQLLCREDGVEAQKNRAGMVLGVVFPKRRPRGLRVGAYLELIEEVKRGILGE